MAVLSHQGRQKGPIVWEGKHADLFRKHADGLPGPTHTLIIARNALDHDEVTYVAANSAAGSNLEKLKWLLHVAFSRFSIEHCFKQAKKELGMDHFEVRGWRSIHRHLYISQLSHRFCSRQRQTLREKNAVHAELTAEQVRDAASVCIAALRLPKRIRRILYQQVARRITYHQDRNRLARESHRKKTLANLVARGMKIQDLPSCARHKP